MVNAYSTPERTAAHMQHIDENFDLIMKLRHDMSAADITMEDCVLAFTELYALYEGDKFQQRRLIINLQHTAKRHKQATKETK